MVRLNEGTMPLLYPKGSRAEEAESLEEERLAIADTAACPSPFRQRMTAD